MFAPASVRRQRVTFTQHRSVGRLDVCTSIGGWLSTGEDKGDRGILLDAGYTTALSRLIEDAMMENARGNCGDSIRPLSLKCQAEESAIHLNLFRKYIREYIRNDTYAQFDTSV